MPFFDVNAFIGRPLLRQHGAVATVEEYFQAVEGTDISRALFWHIGQRDGAPDVGNPLLSRAIAGDERALGCWTILPPQTDRDVMTPDLFERMAAEKIVALRAFPDMHRYVLDRTTFAGFLDQVAELQIPLLLSPRFGCDWPTIHNLLEAFPTLTCVICDVGVWGQDRNTWPLLERFPNTYLDSSMVSLEAGGLEAAVRAYGARRIVFGTGFPYHTPHAAVLDLLHAEISEADREKIAWGNATALLGEAVISNK
ncbi:MAG: amidohydrolase family protein [Armatimonadota bacterium]